MKYLKIAGKALLLITFVFSVSTVIKLKRIDVSPDALLFFADEITVKNKIEPTLSGGKESGNDEVTITFSNNTSHILAVIEDKVTGEKTYELITPSKVFDLNISSDDKKMQNSLLKIISGSGDANAAHCKDIHLACSGTYVDPMGYVRKKCWCTN